MDPRDRTRVADGVAKSVLCLRKTRKNGIIMSNFNTHMKKVSTAVKRLAKAHDHMSAMQIGAGIFILLVAALFNPGAFGILVLTHMALDVIKYRQIHQWPWSTTLVATLRESLVDLALLSFIFCIGLYASFGAELMPHGTILATEALLFRALVVLLVQVEVCRHVLHGITDSIGHFPDVRLGVTGPLYPIEVWAMCLLSICIFLIVLIPILLHLTTTEFTYAVLQQLIPWRIY